MRQLSLLTEREVIKKESQTEALMIKASVSDFPVNDQTVKINKLFIIWPFHYGLEPVI